VPGLSPTSILRWERYPKLAARPGVGAQEHVISEAQVHGGLTGSVSLKLLLQLAGVLNHVRERLFAQRGDDRLPGLPGEFDRSHAQDGRPGLQLGTAVCAESIGGPLPGASAAAGATYATQRSVSRLSERSDGRAPVPE
jgi:hypothetical protein